MGSNASNPILDAAFANGTLDRLLAEGLDFAAIARRLGVSEFAYRRWRKRHTQIGANDTQSRDFADEEPTHPGVRVQVVEETISHVEEHRLKRRIRDLEAENRELAASLNWEADDVCFYWSQIALAREKENREPRAVAEYLALCNVREALDCRGRAGN